MTKFTPRPWFRKGKRVFWKKPDKDLPHETLPNGMICICQSAEDWPECDEEAHANGDLIAAAPDMYEFIEHLTTTTGHALLSQAGYLGENLYKEAQELCRKARGEKK